MSILLGFQVATAAIALLSLLIALRQPARTVLVTTWALFCASLFFMMSHETFAGELGVLGVLVGIAGASTCGWFWLFARALFRQENAVQPIHAVAVGVIALPAFVLPLAEALSSGAEPAGLAATAMRLSVNASMMTSSAVLLLAFFEAFRAWPKGGGEAGLRERRLRYGFAGYYAGSVALSVMWVGQAAEGSLAAQMTDTVKAMCAFLAVVVTGLAFRYRLYAPQAAPEPEAVPVISPPVSAREPEPTPEDLRLARRLERLVQEAKVYLIPTLKVSDLAARIGEPDYKVSRAITRALGYANVNQFINCYRVDHAKALLADPQHTALPILSIALDSGFGSIGPFNRAFKAQVGMTPSAFRAQCAGGAGDEGRALDGGQIPLGG